MTDARKQPEHAKPSVGLDEELFASDLDESTIVARLSKSPNHVPDASTTHELPQPATQDTPHQGKSSTSGEQPPWVDRVLGHFRLQRLLGQGAMGMVVQAQDINLRRIVALKILRKRIRGVDEQSSVQQFLREARAAAQLEHPNVVRVYEINEHRGWWYIAYELIEGGNLKSIVKTLGPLPPNRACPMIADAADALAAAHDSGIIHRDVKPSNLMLARTGRCKIMDFGLVRLTDPTDPVDFTDKSVGTPQYMPPDIIQRLTPTPASDVYSLGATLYFALTGEPPFTGKTVQEIIGHHLHTPAPSVLEKAPNCSPMLARLVARMLAKDPAERPTAAEIAAALRTESLTTSTDSRFDNMSTGSFIALASEAARKQQTPGKRPARTTTGSTVGFDNAINSQSFIQELQSAKRVAWLYMLIGAMVASVIVAIIFYFMYGGPPHPEDYDEGPAYPGRPANFAPAFPEAPASYADSSDRATPSMPDVPKFSWTLTIPADGAHFVAARQGRFYYPLSDPRAKLITPDQYIGYATANQAKADGKIPAPLLP